MYAAIDPFPPAYGLYALKNDEDVEPSLWYKLPNITYKLSVITHYNTVVLTDTQEN